jgi:HlyD family secretion protein
VKTKWKILIGILVVVAAVGVVLYNQLRPLAAETAVVQRQDLVRSFTEEGRVVPRTEQGVYSLYGGEVRQIAVTEGQRVNRGDLLVELDVSELTFQREQVAAQLRSVQGEEAGIRSTPFEASVKSQELQITLAEQNLQSASDHFDRMSALHEAGAVADADVEEASRMLETSRINLELQQEALKLLYESRTPAGGTRQFYQGRIDAIRAQMDLIDYQIEKGRIRAPLDGTVANVTVKAGEPASPVIPMMMIFTGDAYEVEVLILTEDVLSVSAGMEVELIQNRQGVEVIFAGRVDRVAPTAVETLSALGLEEQRVKVTIEPAPDDPSRLFPGVRLDVRFITDRQENVMAVRKTLLFSYEDGEALWVVENGRARIRPVVTGFENDRDVVIDSGLEPGDRVILSPQLEGLSEGKRISI